MLKVKELFYQCEEQEILKNISFNIEKNKFVGIIGENGCGKSTLLKNIYGVLKKTKGDIVIAGMDLNHFSKKKLAQKIAVLAQSQKISFDFTVKEIVEMGRYAHNSFFKENILENKKIIEEALEVVGLLKYKDRNFFNLSGGEIQRVLIARALAQKTDLLILDEPTNHLDIKYQLQIMNIIKKQEKTVLAVIHDMNIASAYCDYIIALKNGKIVKEGKPIEIFTKKNIREIFNVEVEIIEHPQKKVPYMIYL